MKHVTLHYIVDYS